MKKTIILSSIAIITVIISCATNPFTGQKTMALVPDSEIFPSAFAQYGQFLSENKVITGTKDAIRVENVGTKIKVASERWLNANGHQGYLDNYKWDYKLVESKDVNAWCMPGGKIVFYTGILPITNDEATMAAVMGHEVAHALADHGVQRMSAGMVQQGLGMALAIGTQNQTPERQQMWMQAYGVTTQFGAMLPFSRAHETEADMIGLTLMAVAGYDPKNAITVWQRMSAKNGQAPPEFMSTHPSNETRIAKITSQIPAAKAEAAKFGVVFK